MTHFKLQIYAEYLKWTAVEYIDQCSFISFCSFPSFAHFLCSVENHINTLGYFYLNYIYNISVDAICITG